MKIETKQIPVGGLDLEEEIAPSELDLDSELISIKTPLKAKIRLEKITNVVNAQLNIFFEVYYVCSRCIDEFKNIVEKELSFTYQVESLNQIIDLSPDIRAEIILDYPIKPLCSPDCKGLCPHCGKNLNKGECNCAAT